jgi:hypothetical protein
MPIFDEFDFYAKCNLGGDDLSFIQGVGLLEFQELMFAASWYALLPSPRSHHPSF